MKPRSPRQQQQSPYDTHESEIEKLADARDVDIYRILKRRDTKRRPFLREVHFLQNLQKDQSTFKQTSSSTDSLVKLLENPEFSDETEVSARSNRAFSIAIETQVLSQIKKQSKDKTLKKLKRSVTEPFLHTWDFNNIDITHEFQLPGIGNLHQYLAFRWRKTAHISYRATRLKVLRNLQVAPSSTGANKDSVEAEKESHEENSQEFKNVLKEEQQSRKNKLVFEMNSEGKSLIIAGTPSELLKCITDKEYLDPNFLCTFFYTHDEWISTTELLKAIISYFRKPLRDTGDVSVSKEIFCRVLQKRIINVLNYWIENHCYDFKSSEVLALLNDFIQSLIKSQNEPERKWGSLLSNTLKFASAMNQEKELGFKRFNVTIGDRKSGYTDYNKMASKLQFLDLNPVGLAQQFCLYDFKLLAQIEPNELLSINRQGGRGPNVKNLQQINEKIPLWVATEILTTMNSKQRVVVLSNFIRLCLNLLELHDFNGFLNIFFGLKKRQVARLRKTWTALSSKLKRQWEELESSININALTQVFDKAAKAPPPKVLPSVLFFRYLDLQERDPTNYENDPMMINFKKLRALGLIIKEIHSSQMTPYDFPELEHVQIWIRKYLLALSEASLNNLSYKIEPHRVHYSSKAEKSIPVSDKVSPSSSSPKSSSRQQTSPRAHSTPTSQNLSPHTTILKQIHEDLIKKWNLPYSKCSIAVDFPRFVTKIQIFDEMDRPLIAKPSKNPKKLFVSATKPQPKTRREYIFTVLTILSQKLGLLKEFFAIKEKFDLYYTLQKSSQVHQKVGSSSPSSPRLPQKRERIDQIENEGPLSDTVLNSRKDTTKEESNVVQPIKKPTKSSPSLSHKKSATPQSQKTEEESPSGDSPSKKSLSSPKNLQINVRDTTGLHIKSQSKPERTSSSQQTEPSEATKREQPSERPVSSPKTPTLPPFVPIRPSRHQVIRSDAPLEPEPTKMPSDNEEYDEEKDDEAQNHDWGKATDRFIKEVIGETSKLTTLLKSVASQGIVSPAWVRLKLVILPDFPFRDIPNGWSVFIHFTNNGEVVVVHEKKERSSEETKLGVPDFVFTWELRLVFDKKLEKLKESRFLISRLATSDAMNSERKAQLKAIMEQYKALGFKRTLALKKKVNEAKSSPSQRVGNTKNLSDKAGGTHEKHN